MIRCRQTMRRMPVAIALGVLVVAVPAQAESEDESVLAAVQQIFDGMRAADPSMVREVFAEDARFAVLRGDPVAVEARSPEAWFEAMDASGGAWDEQIYDVEVQVDGAMASAWVPYTLYVGDELVHCGINSIELLRDASGWKVTQISDTRRRTDCPDPRGR